MRLSLNVDLCRSLLEVYTNHDLPSCTDFLRVNRFANSEGWVACTRCWLLEVVDTNIIPGNIEFNLYSTVKIPKRDTSVLLGEFAEILNSLGVEHPCTKSFIEINNKNVEFMELAEVAIALRRKVDRMKL